MNHKDKESSYYDRMNSTMSHKIKAIAPIVTKNKDKENLPLFSCYKLSNIVKVRVKFDFRKE